MLDTLPNELIVHILHLLPSRRFQPLERQDILASLCQVNKRIRSAVQPILYDRVYLDKRHTLDVFLETIKTKAVGVLVRSLHLVPVTVQPLTLKSGEVVEDNESWWLVPEEDFAAFGSRCPRLEELRMDRTVLNLIFLEQLPGALFLAFSTHDAESVLVQPSVVSSSTRSAFSRSAPSSSPRWSSSP
jgi:hypothetical protein